MKIIIAVLIAVTGIFFVTGQLTEIIAQEKVASSHATSSSSGETEDAPEDPIEYSRPQKIYDPGGRRDPFRSLVPKAVNVENKLKGLFNYEGAKLIGIVNSESDKYALVVDESGFGYVLREGYKVFGGYVTQITEDALHLHIVKYGRSLSIIMRLESSKSAVYEEKEFGESVVQKPGINISYTKDDQPESKVLIEEVSVPFLDIKTIEEVWFGSKDTIPVPDVPETEESTEYPVGLFSLIDPPDNSWITLPYVLDWSKSEGGNISYTIYIDDDSDFSTPLFIKEGLTLSSFLLSEDTQLPPNRNLFWKIIAQDVSGNRVTCRRTDMSFKIIGKK